MANRVLVVEDDPRTAAFVEKGLRESGFIVDVAADGDDGLYLARTGPYGLVVLDLMLPGIDGETLLRELRASGSRVPVVVLTARGRVEERVRGLTLGADDYLPKPFAFTELLARIRAVLRRGPDWSASMILTAADLVLDVATRRARRGEARLDLTPKEFALLELLLRHKGEVLSRTFITERVWDMSFDSGTNVVDVHIRRLRSKIDDAFDPKLIHTVRGVGYLIDEHRGS